MGTDKFADCLQDIQTMQAQVMALTEFATGLAVRVAVLETDDIHPE